MPTNVQTVISGSHEAVAEVVMAMRQALYLQIVRSQRSHGTSVVQIHGVGSLAELSRRPFDSTPFQGRETPDTTTDGYSFAPQGIEDLASHSRFRASFTMIAERDLAGDLARVISGRHPDVVVAVVYMDDKQSGAQAEACRDGESWSNGEQTRFILPVRATGAEGPLTAADLEAIDRIAATGLRQRSTHRPPSAHGWPRWSLFAHAANTHGAIGLAYAATAGGGRRADMAASLLAENEIARRLGVASWVDTLMFGEAPPPAGAASRRPYTSTDPCSWAPRQQAMLGFLADNLAPEAPQHAFAAALVQALGDPAIRLQRGLHPIAFLPSAMREKTHEPWEEPPVKDLTPALAAICDAFSRAAADTPPAPDAEDESTEKLKASVITAALVARGEHGTLAAAACALAPELLLRSLDNLGGGEAQRALHVFAALYGSFAGFPEPLQQEVRRIGGALCGQYAASVTHEAMQERVHAAGPAAPEEKRSRRLGAGV